MAVNLPGRLDKAGDHAGANFADWAQSVLADLDAAEIDRAVFVGHSLAGGTLLSLARQAPERIQRLIFIAAVLPEEGGKIFDNMPPDAQVLIGGLRDKGLTTFPEMQFAANTDGKNVVDYVEREAVPPFFDPISFAGLRNGIPCTYVKLMRDRAISTSSQHEMAATLAKHTPCDLVEFEAGHICMLTHPEELAKVLNNIGANT